MSDPAHKETDRLLKEMEKKIAKEYRQAEQEISEKMADYLKRFETKDKIWRKWVDTGKKTEKEYNEWKIGQMAMGKRWSDLRDTLAQDLLNANKISRSIVNGYMPDVYAINHNYGTYEIEHGLSIDTSYTLYDHQTVERILRDDPDLLPTPGKKVSQDIIDGKALRWNKKQIQSVMIQSILQGESIPDIATRLAETVSDSDRKAAVRNARTMTTGAENAGRVDSYKRAQRMGIDARKQWVATLDGRTRHEHRLLDGQVTEPDEAFNVEGELIRFPGDPWAAAHLIYNCRCTLIADLAGFHRDLSDTSLRYDKNLGKMSYGEWKKQKKSYSNPILLPEEKAAAIKESYINEYRGYSVKESATSSVAKMNVDDEYEKFATPGEGNFTIAPDRKFKNREEENMRLIYEKYGGDIEALPEIQKYKKKNPDYMWNKKLWEEKEPEAFTKNAIDKNIQAAIHQIHDNPGGIVLDVGNSDMSIDDIINYSFTRIRRSSLNKVDVLLIRNGAIEGVYRYKK